MDFGRKMGCGGTGSLWGASAAASRWPSSPASRPPAGRTASTSRSGCRTSSPGLTPTPPPASASFSHMSGGTAGTPRPSRPTDAARTLACHPHGRPPHPMRGASPSHVRTPSGRLRRWCSPRLRTTPVRPPSRTEANSIQPCPGPGKCCLNGRLPSGLATESKRRKWDHERL